MASNIDIKSKCNPGNDLSMRVMQRSEVDAKARPLSDEQFGHFFESFESSAWRLELLPHYQVEGELEEFEEYLSGEAFPMKGQGEWWRFNEEWQKTIESHVGEGRYIGRVHVLPESLTSYLLYEIEWGYVYNHSAGDDIKLLEFEDFTDEMKSIFLQDFWVFDEKTVVLCDYEEDGVWMGARALDEPDLVSNFLAIRELAVDASIDLKQFLRNYRSGKYVIQRASNL